MVEVIYRTVYRVVYTAGVIFFITVELGKLAWNLLPLAAPVIVFAIWLLVTI